MFYSLSYGIGHGFKFIPDNITLKAALHGVVSGLLSPARGGNFKSGYMSAFFAKLSGGIDLDADDWVQGTFQTLVGGTASEIGGGKFANGAVSAAMVYLFNDSAGKFDKNAYNLKGGYIKDLKVQINKMSKKVLKELMLSSTWKNENRYIFIKHGNGGEWFDLKHALVASKIPLGQGFSLGLVWETGQYYTKKYSSTSAFIGEDLYSNAVGAITNIYSYFSSATTAELMYSILTTNGNVPISESVYRTTYGY